MAGSAKRDKKRAELAERRRKALELRLRGATYDQIAKALGYKHRSNARKDIEGELRALEAQCAESAEELRQQELMKLRMMELGFGKRPYAGDEKAVDRLLRIMERRAALVGLDAPRRTEVTGAEGGPISLDHDPHERLLDRLARLATAGTTSDDRQEPEPG